MDYDFSGLCADQLEKLQKSLTSLNKSFIQDYKISLNVINNKNEMYHRSETIMDVEDILNDAAKKCEIFFTEALNKAQRSLRKFL